MNYMEKKIYPLISIIVPVHNSERFLEKCITSILNQSYVNFELLLVLSGEMNDDSEKICTQFANKDGRIRILKASLGVAAARNIGLKNATGEYIGFVDSDDWIEKEMFEILANPLITGSADISICRFRLIQERLKHLPELSDGILNCSYTIIESKDALRRLGSNHIESFCWNKLFRASVIKNIVFPSIPIYEDVAVMVDIFKNVSYVALTDCQLYNYVSNKSSLTKRRFIEDRIIALEVLSLRFKQLKELGLPADEFMAKVILGNYVTFARAYVFADKNERKKNKNRILELNKTFSSFGLVKSKELVCIESLMLKIVTTKYFYSNSLVVIFIEVIRRLFNLFIKTMILKRKAI